MDTIYERVTLRGVAREALLMPATFAQWAQLQVSKTSGMEEWKARRWFEAFLQAVTGVSWIVSATSIVLASVPKRVPGQPLPAKQRPLDDPPLPLQSWMQEMALDDAEGAVVLRFIAGVLAETARPSYLPDLSHLKPFAK